MSVVERWDFFWHFLWSGQEKWQICNFEDAATSQDLKIKNPIVRLRWALAQAEFVLSVGCMDWTVLSGTQYSVAGIMYKKPEV